MAVTVDKLNYIARVVLQRKLEEDGQIVLNPRTVKRGVLDQAKKLGIEPHEAAELARLVINSAYTQVMAELDLIKDPSDIK